MGTLRDFFGFAKDTGMPHAEVINTKMSNGWNAVKVEYGEGPQAMVELRKPSTGHDVHCLRLDVRDVSFATANPAFDIENARGHEAAVLMGQNTVFANNMQVEMLEKRVDVDYALAKGWRAVKVERFGKTAGGGANDAIVRLVQGSAAPDSAENVQRVVFDLTTGRFAATSPALEGLDKNETAALAMQTQDLVAQKRDADSQRISSPRIGYGARTAPQPGSSKHSGH